MKPKLVAVIHQRSINAVTGLRSLVENVFEKVDFELTIEITIEPAPEGGLRYNR